MFWFSYFLPFLLHFYKIEMEVHISCRNYSINVRYTSTEQYEVKGYKTNIPFKESTWSYLLMEMKINIFLIVYLLMFAEWNLFIDHDSADIL